MGIGTNMKCQCGYEADILVGSGMAGDCSLVPHCCDGCGVVNVDLLASIPSCPQCASTRIRMYGEVQSNGEQRPFDLDLPDPDNEIWLHDARATVPEGDVVEQWGNWRITVGRHYCPSCRQMTLRVARNYVMNWD